jgi:hypothetical protein
MNWLIPALYNAFAMTAYYLFLATSPHGKGVWSKIAYGCMVLVGAGVFGAILLAGVYVHHKEAIVSVPRWTVFVPALLTPTIVVGNILALSWGGSIATSVVNLNTVLTLLAGAWLLGDKINAHVLGGIALGVAGISYATMESIKIN